MLLTVHYSGNSKIQNVSDIRYNGKNLLQDLILSFFCAKYKAKPTKIPCIPFFVINAIFFLVASVNDTYFTNDNGRRQRSDFYGAKLLPSLSGKGAYLQHGLYFYELKCNSTSCYWTKMEQTLTKARYHDIMSYLPPDYDC